MKAKPKSRKEARKEARKLKQQRRLQSWTLHQTMKKTKKKKFLNNAPANEGSGHNEGFSDEKELPSKDASHHGLKKKKRKFMGNPAEVNEGVAMRRDLPLKDGSVKPKSKRKEGQKTMKKRSKPTKFEEYLDMQQRKLPSMEDDLAMEARLLKKLNAKDGKLKAAGDCLDDLLAGIESFVPLDDDMVGTKHAKKKKNASFHVDDDDDVADESNADDDVDVADESNADDDVDEDTTDVNIPASKKVVDADSSDKADDSDSGYEIEESNHEKVEQNPSVKESTNETDIQEGHIELEDGKGLEPKYVPPHLRAGGSSDTSAIRRHIRGLLNRLSEANVESLTSEIASKFQEHGRRIVGDIVQDEVLAACSEGPRGNEQFAAVFAAFITGMAANIGMDFGAKFMARLASCFEEKYKEEDNLAVRNLALLISSLFTFNLIASDLIYDLLGNLSNRFKELDVATILQLLQSCGMGLRNSDPLAMKDFILKVQQCTSDLKSSLVNREGGLGKRIQFMLEAISEIKNNKRRQKDDPVPFVRLKKWLQKIQADNVQLRSLTWARLLDPGKKGQWWLPGVEDFTNHPKDLINVTNPGMDVEKMLGLAASQRMNTDARRAVFCIVMSGEDYVDAFEKLLRLKLPAKQDREMVRVTVECCLQEKVFNKYYALLVSKLCHTDKNHKFSLQYCIWDHFKQLENMEIRRSSNLARLLAFLVGSSSTSLAILKAVDFADNTAIKAQLILHFRIFFEALLLEHSEEILWKCFSRIANSSELSILRDGLSFFLQCHVNSRKKNPWRQKAEEVDLDSLDRKCMLAKRALSNSKGLPWNKLLLTG